MPLRGRNILTLCLAVWMAVQAGTVAWLHARCHDPGPMGPGPMGLAATCTHQHHDAADDHLTGRAAHPGRGVSGAADDHPDDCAICRHLQQSARWSLPTAAPSVSGDSAEYRLPELGRPVVRPVRTAQARGPPATSELS